MARAGPSFPNADPPRLPILYYQRDVCASGDAWQAVLQLRVKGRPAQIILRNMLKFAPWEVTHTGIWHGMNVPFGSAPTPLGWTLFAVSMGLSFLYFISLFVRNGHPPYDGLAGTQVARVLADNDP